ncbi:transcriptional regulator, Crp/Fnr family [Campylobacter blaseri]|uniref:Cyclic nucleotide-binding protein n=1 Tax=Campylobacter blaseri TaxID=2042961 RepID=A0A2P8R0X9_9BACT|nr:Crp/Fnr family transcriptional regulator [Campylobacter blaseri]PSM52157.1 cyclic nucleotide-binding protein [Campylobacter blaseri]PSM53923.1 cyclic nucleotide-binding protein [Campylobacter blaseri]QKF85357.1 transcriptional regulator, Crp/Fnr family [Campylobacter blaseri]
MSSEKVAQTLKSLPFFLHLDDISIRKLASNFKITQYKKGEILQYEDEVKSYFYYLLSGEVKLYKTDRLGNEIFLYHLFNGSAVTSLNYGSLDFNSGSYANIEFTKDSEVLYVNGKYLSNLIKCDDKIALEFLKCDHKKIKLLEETITKHVVYDVTARVASMIVNDLSKLNELKKYEVASMLHIQPETLSRVLAKLSRNELIEVNKNTVEIKNEAGLREIYEQDEEW